MAFIPIPHGLRVELFWMKDGQQEETVLTFVDETDEVFDDIPGFSATVQEAAVSRLIPQMFEDIEYRGVRVRDMRAEDGVSYLNFPGTLVIGALETDAHMPNSVSWAIKKSTAVGGRGGRGRIYWPSIDSSIMTDDNAISGTYADLVVGVWNAFFGNIEDDYPNVVHVVAHCFEDGAPLAACVTYPVLTLGYTDLTIDSQRRRLPGRGA